MVAPFYTTIPNISILILRVPTLIPSVLIVPQFPIPAFTYSLKLETLT